jgi:hypothetical protein
MGDQEFHDFEADGIADCLEHGYQSILLSSRNGERAAGLWHWLDVFYGHIVLYRNFTMII